MTRLDPAKDRDVLRLNYILRKGYGMDISQVSSNSIQTQWQSLLASLDTSNSTQSSSDSSDLFSNLLQTSQPTSSSQDSNSTSDLAMLQALQGMYGNNNANDPFLQALDSTDTSNSTDPFLQALNSMTNANSSDPFLQALDTTDSSNSSDPFLQALNSMDSSSSSSDPFMEALDGSSDSTGFGSDFSMLQALMQPQSSDTGATASSTAASGNSLAMLQALTNNSTLS